MTALETTDGRATLQTGSGAPSITFTQPLNNAAWAQNTITSAPFAVGGNPLLISVAGDQWNPTNGLMVQQVVVDTGAGVQAGAARVCANPANNHMPLVRGWSLLPGVPASSPTVTVGQSPNTSQNSDDKCCVTVCELAPGAPLAVRAILGPQSIGASGTEPVVLYAPFKSFGGRLLIRAAGSAIPSGAGLVSFAIDVDGQEVARSELMGITAAANQWHLATVPVDVLVDAPAGPHVIGVRVSGGTTDINDMISLLVLEQVGPSTALSITPLLVNSPCTPQSGAGVAAQAAFASGGGTLVLQLSASVYASVQTRTCLAVELDGQPLTINGTAACLYGAVNTSGLHLAMVSNDLVVTGVPAGPHTIWLVATDNATCTSGDDRCSITVLELGPTA